MQLIDHNGQPCEDWRAGTTMTSSIPRMPSRSHVVAPSEMQSRRSSAACANAGVRAPEI